jgi:hypothetical protein
MFLNQNGCWEYTDGVQNNGKRSAFIKGKNDHFSELYSNGQMCQEGGGDEF